MAPFQIDSFKHVKMPHTLKTSRAGRLAFIIRQADMKNNRYRSDLCVLRGKTMVSVTSCGDVANFWWLDADTLLFTRAPGKAKGPGGSDGGASTVLYRVSAKDSGKPKKHLCLPCELAELAALPGGQLLYTGKAGQKALPAGARRRDEADYEVLDTLPFWENGGGFTGNLRTRLYLYDGKKTHTLTDDSTNISCLQLSHDAKSAYFLAVSCEKVMPVSNRLHRFELKTGKTQDLSVSEQFSHEKFALADDGSVVVFGSDMKQYGINQNGAFYLLRAPWNNPRRLYDGGDYGAWCSVNTDLAHARDSTWAAADGRVYWLTTIEDNAHIMSIDTTSGLIDRATNANGAVFEFCLSRHRKKNVLYYTAMRGLSGPELYKISESEEECCLSSFNTAMSASFSFVAPEALKFHNEAGSNIKGFVMRPHRFEAAQKYPAVLYIHGGPKTTYGSILFHELQYLAGRGYGVLFANPTGSDGKGDAFADLRGRYGTVDYNDIMLFLKTVLEANPWIDAKRVGVAGGSYGGFMVNWIIGHTNAFAAAVSQRSISNWSTMANLSDIGYYFEPDQAGATTWSEPAKLWDSSPLKYADRVKTPTLFLHSDEDYRCPLAESLQLYTALQLFGVDTRLCLFHGENHELSRSGKPRHRVTRLAEITNWFDKYLK